MKSTALPKSLKDWLARKPAKKQVKRIPAMSEKRKREAAIYSKKRKAFLQRLTVCEAGFCMGGKATEIHHVAGRIRAKLNDEEEWLSVCRYCHNRIHARPSEARRLGLLA